MSIPLAGSKFIGGFLRLVVGRDIDWVNLHRRMGKWGRGKGR
jgi:hypothetical protein